MTESSYPESIPPPVGSLVRVTPSSHLDRWYRVPGFRSLWYGKMGKVIEINDPIDEPRPDPMGRFSDRPWGRSCWIYLFETETRKHAWSWELEWLRDAIHPRNRSKALEGPRTGPGYWSGVLPSRPSERHHEPPRGLKSKARASPDSMTDDYITDRKKGRRRRDADGQIYLSFPSPGGP
jgi:hypothetical protein